HSRRDSLRGAQICVATAQRQALGLADSWTADDLDRERKIRDELLDHDALLGIFLSKIGSRWLDQIEENRHDSRDSLEMTGPAGPFQVISDRPHRDGAAKTDGVDRRQVGDKHQIDAALAKQSQVAIGVTRIGGEIFCWTKLEGIDKNTHDHG